MSNQRNYEVMRFLEHEGRCHITMDVVKGELLMNYLRDCPMIEKKQLFLWIQKISSQIEKYHRCKKNQCYRFLNVYSVVITEKEAYLLDLEAEGNEYIAKYMQRQEIRNGFSHPRAQMRATTKTAIDLYGLGKTIQYLLAHCQVVPKLTRKEEHLLSKAIQKSIEVKSKNQYQNFKQIRNDLSKLKSKQFSKKEKLVSIILLALVGMTCISGGIIRGYKSISLSVENSDNESILTDNASESIDATGEDADVARGDTDATAEETEDVMQRLKEDSQANTAAANKEMIQIGAEVHMEVLQYLALAYDREEMNAQAISAYGELCHMSLQKDLLEQVYKRRAELQEKEQLGDAAIATLKEALDQEMLSQSSVLQLLYLKMVCKSQDMDKEQKENACTEVWKQMSDEVKKSEEYQKLTNEYMITEEGDKLCIGKE